ncbi:hypothetical protein PSHT_06304, partial [Puccinia striiformis]
MAKSTHTSAAPRKQSTKPTPLPPVPKSPTTKKKRKVAVYLRLNRVNLMLNSVTCPLASLKKRIIIIKILKNQPKKCQKIPRNLPKNTRRIIKKTKKSEKKNEEIVKPVEKLDKKSEPVKIAKKMKDCNQGIQITKSLQLEFMNLENKSKPQKPPEDSLVQQLRESLADSSFFNETKYNKDGDINSIFSYHPVSFKLLLNYPKIIFLDSPANYKKYQMHLIHIAGLGENNEQFSIAFSFISTRSTPSYAWTLQ